MAFSQVQSSSSAFEAKVRQRVSTRFLVWASLLLGLALLFADNKIQHGFGSADDSFQDQVQGQEAQNQGNSTRQVCYLLVFGIGVLCYRKMRPVEIAWRSPVALSCAALLGWCACSVVWSDDPATSVKRLLSFVCVATGAAGMMLVWSRRNLAQFLSLFGFAQVTLGFLNELMYSAFRPWSGGYRFSGTQHENVQGFCCVLWLLASLAAADMTPRHRVLFRCLAAYSGIFLVLTQSRSSLLGIALGLTVYVLLTRPSHNIGWLVGVLFVFGYGLYMSDVLNPVVSYLSRDGEGLTTFTGRKPLWSLAEEFVQRRPLTGSGYQVFWTGDHIEYFSGSFGWQISSAHNGFLESLLTLGYVGMWLHGLVLLCVIVCGALYFRRTGVALYALACAFFVAMTCAAMFESVVIVSSGPYSFGVAALLCALCFEPIYPGMRGEMSLRPRRLGPRPANLPGAWVKV